jgi:excisionase family DNA binding protein
MATKHDRALASFLVGLDDVVEELRMVSDPQRSGELAEQLMAMGKQLKRAAPDAARGVPVAEAAKYLGVSEPTVRLWVRRGVLAALQGSKPMLIEHESLRGVGRAIRELRARGEDREWLEGVVRYVEDMADRSSPSVRQGLRELAEGKLQPA